MAYRSGLEERVAKLFDINKIPYTYESKKYKYVIESNYTPDFFVGETVYEAKGFFKPEQRRKMLAVKKQHPELDIRMIFQRNNTLSKSSKTTYGDWCDKHGFPWCVFPLIPKEWFNELPRSHKQKASKPSGKK